MPAGCEPLCVGRLGVSGGGGSFIPKKVMAIGRRFVYLIRLVNRVCVGGINNSFCTIFSVLTVYSTKKLVCERTKQVTTCIVDRKKFYSYDRFKLYLFAVRHF